MEINVGYRSRIFFNGLTKATIKIIGNINPKTKAILNSVKEKEAACTAPENKDNPTPKVRVLVREEKRKREHSI